MFTMSLLQMSLVAFSAGLLLLTVLVGILLVGLMRQERLRHQEGQLSRDQMSVQTIERHLFLISLPSNERIGWQGRPDPKRTTVTTVVAKAPAIADRPSPRPIYFSSSSGDTTAVGRALRTS